MSKRSIKSISLSDRRKTNSSNNNHSAEKYLNSILKTKDYKDDNRNTCISLYNKTSEVVEKDNYDNEYYDDYNSNYSYPSFSNEYTEYDSYGMPITSRK